MATLVFDGNDHTITLKDRNGNDVGTWPANNIVTHHGDHLPYVPNGNHTVATTNAPRRHHGTDAHGIPNDSTNGAYGRYGAVVMNPIRGHSGVAVHSGRATLADGRRRTGVNHATEGCIRTTDEAMAEITRVMHRDPITTVTVQNNHVQN